MKIPKGMKESEVLSIINRVANNLGPLYKFGINDEEDIAQIASIYALEILDHYSGGADLENYLYIHVRNRLASLKRDSVEIKRRKPSK